MLNNNNLSGPVNENGNSGSNSKSNINLINSPINSNNYSLLLNRKKEEKIVN